MVLEEKSKRSKNKKESLFKCGTLYFNEGRVHKGMQVGSLIGFLDP